MNHCTHVSLKSRKYTICAMYFKILSIHFIEVFKILRRGNIGHQKRSDINPVRPSLLFSELCLSGEDIQHIDQFFPSTLVIRGKGNAAEGSIIFLRRLRALSFGTVFCLLHLC